MKNGVFWSMTPCNLIDDRIWFRENVKSEVGGRFHQNFYIQGVTGGMDQTSGGCSLC